MCVCAAVCLLWGPETDWQETKQLWKQMATHNRKTSVINVMYHWEASTGKCRSIFTSKHEWSFSLETINQPHNVISRNIRTGSLYKCYWRTLRVPCWKLKAQCLLFDGICPVMQGRDVNLLCYLHWFNEALDQPLLKCLFCLSRGTKIIRLMHFLDVILTNNIFPALTDDLYWRLRSDN